MRAFFKNKAVQAGVFMLVFYQLIMLPIFMGGYSALPKNMTNITLSLVNEDAKYGKEFAAKLKEQLPFRLVTDQSLAEAKQALNDRDVQFVMHIPQDFSESLAKQGETAKLEFLIDQSNPSTVTQTAQSAINQISAEISKQIEVQSIQGAFQSMKVPQEQAAQMAQALTGKVETNTVVTNPQPAGMHNQMAPFFLSMAMYVGAMIYSMMSTGALKQLSGRSGKWKAFGSLQGVNLIISLIAPLVGVSIYFAVHGYGAEAFFKVWMTHSLEMFTAIEFTSIFCMLAGQGGMLLNMPLLLTQSISAGSVMTRDIMPGYYKFVSYISPMYYSVQLDYNTLFGGGKSAEFVISLALIAAAALVLNSIIHLVKPGKGKELSVQTQAGSLPAMQ
ncbi:DUF3533 domain-containing protein [Paenibacillus sp. HN-1]|uniref:YhgE/Pip domain-containing protein n=1 Tax=Paenibacillus TaxID=44249 RepID=UPI001CA90A9B|nr:MULTISPECIES: ABC transporter permease [Paenibacillus]MBY9079655.1 DUF3533 domain-containing protein [Paenibacillus sp. CGMCC 1.18879]MBY9082906.1 DUF3533 domain-containing protein [Paenibacillus sinensis]